MKHVIREWLPGYETDPRYVALGAQLTALAEEIRAVLAPTGFGGVIDVARARVLETRRAQVSDSLRELKRTFIIAREIDIPDGVPFHG